MKMTKMLPSFSILDYTIFTIMLLLSAVIGIYYAFFAKKKQNTTSEYLMGGRSMSVFPVSMSLISSFISGITLLGMPAEMYVFGTQFWMILVSIVYASFATGFFFVPVFYQLQLTSSYQYLLLRFDPKVRLLGSLLYTILNVLTIPIVIYLPGLAFNQVSGVNPHIITPLVCLVCIFYTSLGGIKAVVWTDTLQTLIMFGAMILIVIIGTVSVGGPSNVWNLSLKGDRIEFFNFDPDPTIRHSFWTITIGTFFMWLTDVSANQGMIQRFLSLPTLKKSQMTVVVFCIGAMFIVSLSCYAGLLIYATYHDCDLISIGAVSRADQLLPYFVMDVAGFIPGFPGIFMAGIFSAALSSMSTGLNALSGVIFNDFIQPWLKHKPSEARASFIMKVICVVIGIICSAMVFVVERLGAVIQVTGSLASVALGPLLGIFVLGMFFPWSNSKGALIGGISSLIVMGCLVFGAQQAIASGNIQIAGKITSTEGCLLTTTLDSYFVENETFPVITPLPEENHSSMTQDLLFIFKISYRYYTLIGFLITLFVGLAVSLITGFSKSQDIDPILLTPPIRSLVFPSYKLSERQFERNSLKEIETDELLPLKADATV